MHYYVPTDSAWTKTPEKPDEGPYVRVADDEHTLSVHGDSANPFSLSGAPARATDETVHTVAVVAEGGTGTVLCALRAEGQDLTVEDRRPPDAHTQYQSAFEQLQSALDEILVPVYIDDAISEISASLDELLIVHTAQYEAPPQSQCTYFRTAVFRDETLLLEHETGAI